MSHTHTDDLTLLQEYILERRTLDGKNKLPPFSRIEIATQASYIMAQFECAIEAPHGIEELINALSILSLNQPLAHPYDYYFTIDREHRLPSYHYSLSKYPIDKKALKKLAISLRSIGYLYVDIENQIVKIPNNHPVDTSIKAIDTTLRKILSS